MGLWGWNPPRLAAYNGNEKVVQLILLAAADRITNDILGLVSLKARFRYKMGITCYCLTLDNTQWTTLYWAAQNGHIGTMEFLLNIGADINVKHCCGWTPLHRIVANGHDGVV
jgi:Ankyrin repeats (3 copies)